MHDEPSIILGIESSCDDTGAAVIKNGKLLANVIAGQEIHAMYGGVVPELASRAHQKNILPTVEVALKESGISKSQLTAIAYTNGPGLLGSLLVGASFAKALALSLGIPAIAVDHMKGHVFSHFIEKENSTEKMEAPVYPFISLTVSGGHTQLVLVKAIDSIEVVGRTIDDAAGEAFDKTAKMLELPYPGGPQIDRLAQIGNAIHSFSKPRIEGLDMSFSGLKTSILYYLRDRKKEDESFIKENLNDICASVQKCIVDILIEKLEKAIHLHRPKAIALGGGVAANSLLRSEFSRIALKHGLRSHIPEFEFCTDNAAMIAMVGYIDLKTGSIPSGNSATKANQTL